MMKNRVFFLPELLPLLLGFLWVCSCSTETALQQILGSSMEGIVFKGVKSAGNGTLEMEFSEPVKVLSLRFDPPLENSFSVSGSAVTASYVSDLPGGSLINAEILVEDRNSSTLNVLFPFRTRNNDVPPLLINEIRTEYSKPKLEFVELRALGSGNLGALRLFAAFEGDKSAIFEFPPVFVSAGEYIVVHLRGVEEGIADESGDSGESAGLEAEKSAWDFWLRPGEKIHSTNAFYVLYQDDRILDAVVLLDSEYGKWEGNVKKAADYLKREKAWSDDPVNTDKTTSTRTICRDESVKDSNTAADWYIADDRCASAGRPNNVKHYEE